MAEGRLRTLATERQNVLAAISLGTLIAWIAFFVLTRPDLHHPAAIGTDASNYYAAGLRLNDGHPLYSQALPGDRPVPIEPPLYTVPLLSPPPIAVAWRLVALLPGNLAMSLWAIACGLILAGTAAWLARRVTLPGAILLQAVAAPVALTILSGNVNAWLAAALVAAWFAHARGRPLLAGVLVGVTVATKLAPVLLLVWFLARGDRRGAAGMVAGGLAMGLFSLAGAGLANHLDYLDVIRTTSAGGMTPWSLPGMLAALGLPPEVARLGPMLAVVGGGLLILVLRRRAAAGFTVALLAGVWATPVVHLVGMSLLLAAVAPHVALPERVAMPLWARLRSRLATQAAGARAAGA